VGERSERLRGENEPLKGPPALLNMALHCTAFVAGLGPEAGLHKCGAGQARKDRIRTMEHDKVSLILAQAQHATEL
jgi:hypothetical protein